MVVLHSTLKQMCSIAQIVKDFEQHEAQLHTYIVQEYGAPLILTYSSNVLSLLHINIRNIDFNTIVYFGSEKGKDALVFIQYEPNFQVLNRERHAKRATNTFSSKI